MSTKQTAAELTEDKVRFQRFEAWARKSKLPSVTPEDTAKAMEAFLDFEVYKDGTVFRMDHAVLPNITNLPANMKPSHGGD